MTKKQADTAGLTVVELMVGLGIFMIAVFGIFMFFESATRQSHALQSQVQMQAEARFTVDEWIREVRSAQSRVAGTPAITTMTPTTLTFLSPNVSSSSYKMRKITYRLTGTNMERSVTFADAGGPPYTFGTTAAYAPVVHGVRTLAFTYRNNSGAITSVAADVATINVVVSVDADPSKDPPAQTFNTTAEIRNR